MITREIPFNYCKIDLGPVLFFQISFYINTFWTILKSLSYYILQLFSTKWEPKLLPLRSYNQISIFVRVYLVLNIFDNLILNLSKLFRKYDHPVIQHGMERNISRRRISGFRTSTRFMSQCINNATQSVQS